MAADGRPQAGGGSLWIWRREGRVHRAIGSLRPRSSCVWPSANPSKQGNDLGVGFGPRGMYQCVAEDYLHAELSG